MREENTFADLIFQSTLLFLFIAIRKHVRFLLLQSQIYLRGDALSAHVYGKVPSFVINNYVSSSFRPRRRSVHASLALVQFECWKCLFVMIDFFFFLFSSCIFFVIFYYFTAVSAMLTLVQQQRRVFFMFKIQSLSIKISLLFFTIVAKDKLLFHYFLFLIIPPQSGQFSVGSFLLYLVLMNNQFFFSDVRICL